MFQLKIIYLIVVRFKNTMGCLLSCCGGEEGDGGQDGERTRLLSECGSQIQVRILFRDESSDFQLKSSRFPQVYMKISTAILLLVAVCQDRMTKAAN